MLIVTSSLIGSSVGGTAPDWCSSMGEGLRDCLQYPHHRRRDCCGLFPAAHRHRWSHWSHLSPPSHALLCILYGCLFTAACQTHYFVRNSSSAAVFRPLFLSCSLYHACGLRVKKHYNTRFYYPEKRV